MYKNRIELYRQLEEALDSKVLVYVTSDRTGFETQIAQDVIDLFINHLDKIGITEKISLYLYRLETTVQAHTSRKSGFS